MARDDVKDANDKSPPFKVGDKVRRINCNWGSLKQGVVYEVERVYGCSDDPNIDLVGFPTDRGASFKNFELVESATPETPKSKWFGYKYRVTPETSKLLQEAVFKDGGCWGATRTVDISCLLSSYLFVYPEGYISHITLCDEEYFNNHELPEKEPPQPVKQDSSDSLLDSLSYALKDTKNHIAIKDSFIEINVNQQEESKMSKVNRRMVNVVLLDNDSGLDVADSVVYDFGKVVAEDSNDIVIQQLLVDFNVKELVEEHNKKRSKITDLSILERTGNDVKLRPVRLKDLTWSIS